LRHPRSGQVWSAFLLCSWTWGKLGISACDVPGVLAGVLSENYNLRSVVYYPCSMPTTKQLEMSLISM
jgi:hypothetical protein